MSDFILHIVPAAVFYAHDQTQPYITDSLSTEGFIHCTKEAEVMLRVANRFYKNVTGDVLVLVIDPQKVRAEVKYEAPAHPEPDPNSPLNAILFPHIYGPLNLDAVVEVRVTQRAADGTFVAI